MPEPAVIPVVAVTGLTKRYGETVAVDDLSFSLPPGTITGFLGPNGAGKTTTLRLLLGLAEPSLGTASVFGRRYGDIEQPCRLVGAVLESNDFHPGRSGRDHLRVLAVTSGIEPGRVEDLLDVVGLSDAASRPVKTYSLGMRQRLGLAGALLGQPELLVLDEPANGLDPAGVRWLRTLLQSFAEGGGTVLVSSHVLAEVAQTVERVVIIDRGRLVADAPLSELADHGQTLEDALLGVDHRSHRVKTQLRAEFLKQRTTRTAIGMLVALLGLVVSALAVHAFGLPMHSVASGSNQLGIFIDVGENLGSLFAALLGAMAITGEIRHGTIRPTLLGTPQRGRVVLAKAVTALVMGVVFGALATGAAAAAGTLFLSIRNVALHVTTGDYFLLIAGGAAAAALWAVIGLGVGAIVRSQVPTVAGILVWVLFVENILVGSLPSIGKFAPGTLGRAIAGATNDTVSAPAIGFALLTLYAIASVTLGWVATNRRDFA